MRLTTAAVTFCKSSGHGVVTKNYVLHPESANRMIDFGSLATRKAYSYIALRIKKYALIYVNISCNHNNLYVFSL